MKRTRIFAVLVTIVMACTVFVGCDTASDNLEAPKKEETPTPDPKDDPKPETTDTTQWKTVGEKTLHVDENRKVTSTIYGLKYDGSLDSTKLVYTLGFELTAPDTVRLPNPGTELTAYTGMLTFPGANHERYWQGKDSLEVVTTTKGYKTSYFDVVWETSHTLGWTIIKGQPEPYKWDVESSQAVFNGNSLQLYREPYEVERGDSIYLREEIRNVVQMTFHGKTFVEEKKVVVDHFLKMKEKEEDKEETIKVDDYLKGLARFISATKVYNTDTKLWGDAYLFEGAESYRIFVRWYSKDDSPKGSTSVEVRFTTCPQSDKYNAVAYIRGNLYPGKISRTGKVWDIGCAVNGTGEVQGYGELDVDFSGIKNFEGNNTAVPSPYIAATPSERTVNGYKIISVTGKTSVHTSKVTIADASLKK